MKNSAADTTRAQDLGRTSSSPDIPQSAQATLDSDHEATSQQRPSLRPLLVLKPMLLAHRKVLIAAIVALVTSAVAMLTVPLAVRRMIDHGFGEADSGMIDSYFLTLILVGLVIAIASPARYYFVNWLGERIVADLRSRVFAHLALLGPSYFDRNHSGEMMSRLTADTTQIKAAAGTALSQALRNAIMLVGALTMMFVTSIELSMLVMVAIPIIVLPLVGLGRLVRKLSRKAQDSLGEASAYAAENLSAHRTMQAFVAEDAVSKRFAGAVEKAFDASRERMKARAFLTGVAVFLTVASITGVLWYGSSEVISGDMTGGRLGQFVLYALFAAGALAELSEVWGEVSQAAGAAERLSEMLATEPDIKAPDNPITLPQPPRGTVTFDAVSFRYPGRSDSPALHDISLDVSRGSTVAIVGPSGAGKTTLFSLLLRFYDPQQGRVLVDGIDVRDVTPEALRARMAVVPQDVALFADTIAANIRYGAPDASDSDVKRAAVAAQADDFIRALPEGYATVIGERGVTLSGGQRQRIAIARALLKNAPILLLDEATSALDAESEGSVQRALNELMQGRTTLVIAHRLATVQRAEKIIVLDEGRIVESGNHAELIKRGGIYARLAELQFNREAAE